MLEIMKFIDRIFATLMMQLPSEYTMLDNKLILVINHDKCNDMYNTHHELESSITILFALILL